MKIRSEFLLLQARLMASWKSQTVEKSSFNIPCHETMEIRGKRKHLTTNKNPFGELPAAENKTSDSKDRLWVHGRRTRKR